MGALVHFNGRPGGDLARVDEVGSCRATILFGGLAVRVVRYGVIVLAIVVSGAAFSTVKLYLFRNVSQAAIVSWIVEDVTYEWGCNVERWNLWPVSSGGSTRRIVSAFKDFMVFAGGRSSYFSGFFDGFCVLLEWSAIGDTERGNSDSDAFLRDYLVDG